MYSRLSVIQAPTNRPVPRSQVWQSNSAYLDPTDRPLSWKYCPVHARINLFGLSAVGDHYCLNPWEKAFQPMVLQPQNVQEQISFHLPSLSPTLSFLILPLTRETLRLRWLLRGNLTSRPLT